MNGAGIRVESTILPGMLLLAPEKTEYSDTALHAPNPQTRRQVCLCHHQVEPERVLPPPKPILAASLLALALPAPLRSLVGEEHVVLPLPGVFGPPPPPTIGSFFTAIKTI
eukprot:CAMPEP_0179252448 /NCGR_PEP_ID=MMETSP0797-20121207/22221_1 /TAXON_ID=47934 /ORGANISM="Dinophysis acuminata, Strain DAEP01" /LENGTH=110 /DNA_ID=CAMNT_0020960281 /DNA_START=112 /DNA_END=441 /DNA_ORIENTATION=+